ncbi:MAG: hypothetical protein ABIR24_03940 [Verrucomicrobiota bacterium]
MNDETKIKLQAYLDGELSRRDARGISELLTTDNEAQSLLGELQMVKSALHGNELELKLPETREFFWSKIQREIERSVKEEPTRVPAFAWWKPAYVRYVGGMAAACALLMISFIAFNNEGPRKFVPGEIEGNGEMGSITYHSNADGMTVVYLFDREPGKVVDSEPN